MTHDPEFPLLSKLVPSDEPYKVGDVVGVYDDETGVFSTVGRLVQINSEECALTFPSIHRPIWHNKNQLILERVRDKSIRPAYPSGFVFIPPEERHLQPPRRPGNWF